MLCITGFDGRDFHCVPQRDNLILSLEKGKVDEESARELAEQRLREAKELEAVVAELTAEVNQLRQDMASAKAEAASLTDERADLVNRYVYTDTDNGALQTGAVLMWTNHGMVLHRLAEAEEVATSLKEEVEEYCQENQRLKVSKPSSLMPRGFNG